MDYWARNYPMVIVIAAGNNGANVSSPGKGWNVITVGGFDDHNNSNWSDDTMAGFSNWDNPSSGIEKPDVVAPPVNVTMVVTVGTPPTLYTDSGTSFAAPQVSGLAALLMNTNSSLNIRPEAVKAIIMASAVHNIDDSRVMPTSTDLKDGAGAIDASVAVQIASTGYPANNSTTCDTPCWWSTDAVSISPDGFIDRTIKLIRGERARVAIAWWGKVSSDYATSSLASNFNLQVLDASGTQVPSGLSGSANNSTELVEFVAPSTGQFTIRVRRASGDSNSNESQNELGIAWTKQATYLPDVRNSGGWASKIYVRNDGAEPRTILVSYFNADGTAPGYPEHSSVVDVQPNASWSPTLPGNWSGSAIVDGSEDLSVVVEHSNAGGTQNSNYTGVVPAGSSGSLGWEVAGGSLYAPVIKNNYYNGNSTIYVMNVGGQSTTVNVNFYTDAGFSAGSAPANTLSPGQRATINAANCSGGLCNARIIASSNGMIAAVVQEAISSPNTSSLHNAFSAAANTLYVPVFKNRYFSVSTGLRIQNAGSASASGTLTFYPENSSSGGCTNAFTIPSYGAITFWNNTCPLANFLGSLVISANQPMVAQINEIDYNFTANTYRSQSSGSAFLGGNRVAGGALFYKDQTENGQTWLGGVAIQNVSSQNATVTIRFYDAAGNLSGTAQTVTLAANVMKSYLHTVANFKGSVQVTADRDVATTVNIINYTNTGDSYAIYNASGR